MIGTMSGAFYVSLFCCCCCWLCAASSSPFLNRKYGKEKKKKTRREFFTAVQLPTTKGGVEQEEGGFLYGERGRCVCDTPLLKTTRYVEFTNHAQRDFTADDFMRRSSSSHNTFFVWAKKKKWKFY
jgi:hypothetical protein